VTEAILNNCNTITACLGCNSNCTSTRIYSTVNTVVAAFNKVASVVIFKQSPSTLTYAMISRFSPSHITPHILVAVVG